MSESKILDIKTKRGTVSKAFEMSMAATIDLRAGLPWLKPSLIDWVREQRRVDVEWRDRKPCCEGEREIKGEILLRTSLSKILDRLERREIGL